MKRNKKSMFSQMLNIQRTSIILIFCFVVIMLNLLIFVFLRDNYITELDYNMNNIVNEYDQNLSSANQIRWALQHDKEVFEDLNIFLQKPLSQYSETRLNRYSNHQSFIYNGFQDYLNRTIFPGNKTKGVHIIPQKGDDLVSFYPQQKISVLEEKSLEDFQEDLEDNINAYFIEMPVKDLITYNPMLTIVTEHTVNTEIGDVYQLAINDSFNPKHLKQPTYTAYSMVSQVSSYDSRFSVTGFISYSKMIQNHWYVFLSNILLLTIIMVFALKKVNENMKVYQQRMQRILDGMNNVEGNDLSRIPNDDLQEADEIEEIRIAFNIMIDRINNYIDSVYRLQVSQAESRLKVLQSQINPHFVYNTLEVIRMNAILDGNLELAEMIFNFSSLFRISIDDKNYHTVEAEISFLKKYLDLYSLRYPDTLSYQISYDEALLTKKILKFLIQPLVENSIMHGFDLSEPGNHIEIDFKRTQNYIIIEVRDNGKGFDLEAYYQEEESVALKNIENRIKIEYQGRSRLKIFSDENGTLVKIIIEDR